MTRLRDLWRRLFPPTDGFICAEVRLTRCEVHRRLGWVCRCVHLRGHRDGHECGQGTSWANGVRSEA